MILLDGKSLSKKRLALLKQKISEEMSLSGLKPGLVVIRVGDDPASQVYVSHKVKACEDVGIHSTEVHLPATTTEADLLKRIQEFNKDKSVHGILVQLPLPSQIQKNRILDAVDPSKDVDGFHVYNLGRLVSQEDGFVPCTPLGIMKLLEEYKISIEGKRAAVVGRSRIVGRPMSLLLDHAGATVTVIHPHTQNPRDILKTCDIVVAAVGRPGLIQPEDIKPGATVIDVGICRLPSGKLAGDVNFEDVSRIAGAITPVPGGVGPMTICSLLENTWKAFKKF